MHSGPLRTFPFLHFYLRNDARVTGAKESLKISSWELSQCSSVSVAAWKELKHGVKVQVMGGQPAGAAGNQD